MATYGSYNGAPSTLRQMTPSESMRINKTRVAQNVPTTPGAYSNVGQAYDLGIRNKDIIGSYMGTPSSTLGQMGVGSAYTPTGGSASMTRPNINPVSSGGSYGGYTGLESNMPYSTNGKGAMMSMTVPSPDQSTIGNQPTTADQLITETNGILDAIAKRRDQMLAQAAEVNRMNTSRIGGTLGRVFGNNADTSESSLYQNENARYGNEQQDIQTSMAQAMADRSMQALLQRENILSGQRGEQRQNSMDAFNKYIQGQQLGLQRSATTGFLDGQSTLDKQRLDQSILDSNRNYGLSSTNQDFNQRMSVLDQMMKQNQLTFDQYTGLRDQAMKESAITGMYNGGQTTAEQQRKFENSMTSAAMGGYLDGAPTQTRYEADQKDALARYLNDNKPTAAAKEAKAADPMFSGADISKMYSSLLDNGDTAGAKQLLENYQKGFTQPQGGEANQNLLNQLLQWFQAGQ